MLFLKSFILTMRPSAKAQTISTQKRHRQAPDPSSAHNPCVGPGKCRRLHLSRQLVRARSHQTSIASSLHRKCAPPDHVCYILNCHPPYRRPGRPNPWRSMQARGCGKRREDLLQRLDDVNYPAHMRYEMKHAQLRTCHEGRRIRAIARKQGRGAAPHL